MTTEEFQVQIKELMLQYAEENNFKLSALISALPVLLEASSMVVISAREAGAELNAVPFFEGLLSVMAETYSEENMMRGVH